MVVSGTVGFYMVFVHEKFGLPTILVHIRLVLGVTITTASWLTVTLLTRPVSDKKLRSFYRLVRPGGPGWNAVLRKAQANGDPITETATRGDLPRGILCMVARCLSVYSTIFAAGFYLYGRVTSGVLFTVLAAAEVIFLVSIGSKLEMK